jgi:hypothetical protein
MFKDFIQNTFEDIRAVLSVVVLAKNKRTYQIGIKIELMAGSRLEKMDVKLLN